MSAPPAIPPSPTTPRTVVDLDEHVAAPPTAASPGQPSDTPRPISAGTEQSRIALWGSLLSAVSLVWILYDEVLPFRGATGFVLISYLAFLLIYATVTSMSEPSIVVRDRLASAAVTGGAALAMGALFTTIFYTLIKGWAAVHHPNFFTHTMAGVRPTAPLNQGGILHAIVGSLIELGIATVISLPLGIGTAVFMVEVGGRWARVVRTVVEAMTALPDILAGLFIYTVFIVGLGVQKSGLAAALALTVMMLPIIARSADVALRVVPGGLREAGLALGSSQWAVVRRVVLPTCKAGLATAVILGMARAVGETAPVLITSGASSYFNVNPVNNPMNSLPLYILSAVRSGEPAYIVRGFGAGIVLLTMVLILFASARYLARTKIGRR